MKFSFQTEHDLIKIKNKKQIWPNMTLQFSYVAFIISLFKDFELTLSKNFKYKSWKFGSMLALQSYAHNSATEHVLLN